MKLVRLAPLGLAGALLIAAACSDSTDAQPSPALASDAGLEASVDATTNVVDGGANDAADAALPIDAGPLPHGWQPVTMPDFPVSASLILAAPSDPKVLFVRTSPSGYFRSTDGGVTWHHLNVRSSIDFHGPVAFDPNDSNVLYAIGGANNGSGDTVLARSDDGGRTWAGLSTPSLSYQTAMAFDARRPGSIYLVDSTSHVVKSVDGGTTWSKLAGTFALPDATNATISQIAVATTGRLYAMIDSDGPASIVASDDDGASWKPLLEKPWGLGGFALAPSDPTRLYAALADEVCSSTDTGAHWTCAAAPPIVNPAQQVIFDSFAGVDPHDPSYVLLERSDGNGHLYASADGAATWTELPMTGGELATAWADTRFLTASATGLSATSDHGATWTDLTHGLAVPYSLSVTYATGTKVYELDAVLRRSVDEAQTWSTSLGPLQMPSGAKVDPLDPDTLIGTDSTVRFLSDGPDAATQKTVHANAGIDLAPLLYDGGVPTPYPLDALSLDPTNASVRYACAGPDLYVTHDSAATWTKTAYGETCTATAIDPKAHATLFAAAESPVRLRKSTDGGQTWLPDPAPIANVPPIRQIVLDPNDGGTIYAQTGDLTYGAQVWRWLVSHDGGATFVDSLWPFDGSSQLAFDRHTPGTIVAAGPGGVWKSVDGGTTWKVIDDGLDGEDGCGIAVSPTDGTHMLLAACAGGVFRSVTGGE